MAKSTEAAREPQTPPLPDGDAGASSETPANGAGDGAAALTATSDIFSNLENLRLKQDFNRAKIKKPFTSCPIRKPRRHEWFQSHRDPSFRFETRLFALKEGMSPEWYLPIGEDVLAELDAGSLYPCVIFPWITRKSEVSVLPVPLCDTDGRDNDWWASMREVMSRYAAEGQWIRIAGGNQAYEVEVAENEALPDPKWPDVPLNTILRTAFKGGRMIDSLDHPVIQANMRGRV
jgi:hypothetical protein